MWVWWALRLLNMPLWKILSRTEQDKNMQYESTNNSTFEGYEESPVFFVKATCVMKKIFGIWIHLICNQISQFPLLLRGLNISVRIPSCNAGYLKENVIVFHPKHTKK